MRLRDATWIHGNAAPVGCKVRRLRLPRGHCSRLRDVRLCDGGHQVRPIGITAAEPWYLLSNLDPSLDIGWAYGQRFCCEQQFQSQKSGIYQLERSGLRCPPRIGLLLLVVTVAVVVRALQEYAVSLAGARRRVDAHWKRELSGARIGLHWIQESVNGAGRVWIGLRSRCRK